LFIVMRIFSLFSS